VEFPIGGIQAHEPRSHQRMISFDSRADGIVRMKEGWW